MTQEEFDNLGPGDVVRGRCGGRSYVVTSNYGDRVTAVDTVDMTNPYEWKLIKPKPVKPQSYLLFFNTCRRRL